jgi:hypothetical protein
MIPTSLYDETDCDHDGSPLCLICLDTFVDGDEIRSLPCSHCFHKKCIDIWLMGTFSEDLHTSICPTCRQSAADELLLQQQHDDIPLDSYLRVGQHLFEESIKNINFNKTPSPPLTTPVSNIQSASPALSCCSNDE